MFRIIKIGLEIRSFITKLKKEKNLKLKTKVRFFSFGKSSCKTKYIRKKNEVVLNIQELMQQYELLKREKVISDLTFQDFVFFAFSHEWGHSNYNIQESKYAYRKIREILAKKDHLNFLYALDLWEEEVLKEESFSWDKGFSLLPENISKKDLLRVKNYYVSTYIESFKYTKSKLLEII